MYREVQKYFHKMVKPSYLKYNLEFCNLQGDILAPYLFVIVVDYALRGDAYNIYIYIGLAQSTRYLPVVFVCTNMTAGGLSPLGVLALIWNSYSMFGFNCCAITKLPWLPSTSSCCPASTYCGCSDWPSRLVAYLICGRNIQIKSVLHNNMTNLHECDNYSKYVQSSLCYSF